MRHQMLDPLTPYDYMMEECVECGATLPDDEMRRFCSSDCAVTYRRHEADAVKGEYLYMIEQECVDASAAMGGLRRLLSDAVAAQYMAHSEREAADAGQWLHQVWTVFAARMAPFIEPIA